LKKFFTNTESSVGWKSITSLAEPLNIGDGFVYRAKDAVSGTLTGELVKDLIFSVTSGSVEDTNYGVSPFTVVGNPFITTIDFELFAADDLNKDKIQNSNTIAT
jgi:hypothetical protein